MLAGYSPPPCCAETQNGEVDRDPMSRLNSHIKVDDALGWQATRKRRGGAVGKTTIIVAVERREAQKKTRRTEGAFPMQSPLKNKQQC